jgi:hypothetical protein
MSQQQKSRAAHGSRRQRDDGGPGVTRTPGTQFRKLLLYPPELRGHTLATRIKQFYETRTRFYRGSVISEACRSVVSGVPVSAR